MNPEGIVQEHAPYTNTLHQGLTGNALKLIAIVTMLVDHMAAAFVPSGTPLYIVMRTIGRTAAPIMFYFIAEGYRRTNNVNLYTLRLALFAIISYIPFIYYKTGELPGQSNALTLNVIYTLFLGLLAIRARNEIPNMFLKCAVIAFLFLFSVFGDWSFTALLLILVFDYFRGDFKKQAFAYCAVILVTLLPMLTHPFYTAMTGGTMDMNYFLSNIFRVGQFIPIILLAFYNGQKGAGGKAVQWSFYIFYPAHLLLIGLIRSFIVA